MGWMHYDVDAYNEMMNSPIAIYKENLAFPKKINGVWVFHGEVLYG